MPARDRDAPRCVSGRGLSAKTLDWDRSGAYLAELEMGARGAVGEAPGDAMIRNKAQILDYLVKKLKSSCPDVEEAALVTDEGLVLVCTSDNGEQRDRLSALTAAAMRQTSRSAEGLDLGETNFVIVAGQNGNLFMKWIDDRSFLAVTIKRNADWRAVRRLVGRTAVDIRHIGEVRGNLASTTQLG